MILDQAKHNSWAKVLHHERVTARSFVLPKSIASKAIGLRLMSSNRYVLMSHSLLEKYKKF